MIDTELIKNKYSRKLPLFYKKSPLFNLYRRRAINNSSIKAGHTVMVFCCGPGNDLPYIMEKTGPEGKIIAMDFSQTMLDQSAELADNNGWKNIDFIQADAAAFDYSSHFNKKAHACICTLGLSIIPNYKDAFYNLINSVKQKGEIIIGDLQSATGFWSIFNPLIISIARPYGGTKEGHDNSRRVFELMRKECEDIKKKEFLFNGYYYAIGKKR
ncbi:methyltransferase domain-containing protein [Spirochaetota bacterium]